MYHVCVNMKLNCKNRPYINKIWHLIVVAKNTLEFFSTYKNLLYKYREDSRVSAWTLFPEVSVNEILLYDVWFAPFYLPWPPKLFIWLLIDCEDGFFGDNCESECQCGDNTVCDNVDGCQCADGYGDLDSDFACSDIDECADNENPCQGTSSCENTVGSYICDCGVGEKYDSSQSVCVGTFSRF